MSKPPLGPLLAVLLVAGLATVAAGVWLVYTPAGLIAAGIAMAFGSGVALYLLGQGG